MRKLFFILIFIAIATILSVGAVSYKVIQDFSQISDARKNALDQVLKFEKIFAKLRDAETGQRGYVITGNKAYLKPYYDALNYFDDPSTKEQLYQISSNPIMLNDYQELTELIDNKLKELRVPIDLRAQQGFAQAQKAVENDKGKIYMDKIRYLLTNIIQQKRDDYEKEDNAFNKSTNKVLILILLGNLLALSLFAVSLGLLYWDIKKRMRVEANLKNVNKEKIAILESAKQAIITTDLQGKISSFNRGAEILFGVLSKEVIGLPILNFYEEKALKNRLLQLARDKSMLVKDDLDALVFLSRFDADKDIIWSIKHKDGSAIEMSQSTVALRDERGNISGYLIVGSDITEQKRWESELVKAEERAQAATMAKSQFLASIGNELLYPVHAILDSMNNLLQNGTAKANPQELQEINTVTTNGKQLLELIQGILDLSKVETEKVDVTRKALNFTQFIPPIIQEFKEQFQAKKIELLLEMPDRLEPIKTDAVKLKQIVTNLIANGLKETSSGYVKVRIVEDLLTRKPKRIDIIDTGSGLRRELKGKIPFNFKGEKMSGVVPGDSALGIALARKYCMLLDYELIADNVPGKGSTFSILLKEHPADKSG